MNLILALDFCLTQLFCISSMSGDYTEGEHLGKAPANPRACKYEHGLS